MHSATLHPHILQEHLGAFTVRAYLEGKGHSLIVDSLVLSLLVPSFCFVLSSQAVDLMTTTRSFRGFLSTPRPFPLRYFLRENTQ